jgi:hypothetical protein
MSFNDDPVETFKLPNGKVLKMFPDNYPENPRTGFNSWLGTMVCWHSRYDLGDEQISRYDPMQFWRDKAADYVPFDTENLPEETVWKIIDRNFIVLPLAILDHSGLHMWVGSGPHWSDSAGWDSGQVGWIYVEKKKVREEYSLKKITKEVKKNVLKVLESEVEVYDQYLSGDVYGYVLEDTDGRELDSCWGFYGYDIKTNGIAEYVPEVLESN